MCCAHNNTSCKVGHLNWRRRDWLNMATIPCISFRHGQRWFLLRVRQDPQGSGLPQEVCLNRRRRLQGCCSLRALPRHSCTLRHLCSTALCERVPISQPCHRLQDGLTFCSTHSGWFWRWFSGQSLEWSKSKSSQLTARLQWLRQAWAWELSISKCRLAHPHFETRCSRIGMWIMQNFQIFIVSAVKICTQCLQTASASGGLVLQTL